MDKQRENGNQYPKMKYLPLDASVNVTTKLDKTSRYLGSNSFGAKAMITSKQYSKISLAIDVEDNILNFEISAPPEKAKQIKETGSALLISKLLQPYTGKATNREKATFTLPIETISNINYVAVNIIEVWIYNPDTGEIYHKEKRNNGNRNSGDVNTREEEGARP